MADQTRLRFTNPERDSYSLILIDVSGKTVRLAEDIRDEEIVIYREGLKAGFYQVQLIGNKVFRGSLIVK